MKEQVFEHYVNQVIEIYGVTRSALFSKDKNAIIVEARQVLYYLCYHRPMRIAYIQMYMAQNGYVIGHSTIIYNIKQMEEKVASDPDYASMIKKIA